MLGGREGCSVEPVSDSIAMGGSRGGSKRQGRGYGPKNAGAKVPSQGTHRPYWVKASDREVAEVLLADTSASQRLVGGAG